MDAFLGEIRLFAGDFAPQGWAICNGALLPVQQNTALFSLLGTTYGGDGRTTFALPNLQAAVPLGSGTGNGLTPRPVGSTGGSSTTTLTAVTMPAHTHGVPAAAARGSQALPAGGVPAEPGYARHAEQAYTTAAAAVPLSTAAVGASGGSQPHNNLPPVLALTFIIALQGQFPTRP